MAITLTTGVAIRLAGSNLPIILSSPTGGAWNVQPRFTVMDAIMTVSSPTIDTEVVFNVCRMYPFGASSVDYTITAGSAVEGTDYDGSADALTGTLNFADEEIYKTVSIRTLNGGGTGNRTLTCTLSNPSNGAIDDAVGTGTIQDGTITTFPNGTDLATIRDAFNANQPGAAILLERGGEFTGTWTAVDRARGTAANPVILGAYGTGARPKFVAVLSIRGRNTLDGESRYIQIQDIEAPVSIGETSRTYLPSDIKCYRMKSVGNSQGFTIGEPSPDSLRINRADYHCGDIREGVSSGGAFGTGVDCEITYTYFFDNGLDDPTREWQAYVGGERQLFKGNVLDGNNRMGGLKWKRPRDATAVGNWIKNCNVLGANMGTNSTNTDTGNVFERNIIENCGLNTFIHEQTGLGPAVRVFQVTFRNNILDHGTAPTAGQAAIIIGDDEFAGNEDCKIYNNTIILSNDVWGILAQDEIPVNMQIYNNLFVHRGGVRGDVEIMRFLDNSHTGITTKNNLFFDDGATLYGIGGVGDYATLAAYQAAFPSQEIGSIETGNQQVVDFANGDLHLIVGADAIGAGFDTTADVPDDMESKTRTVPVDIGAFKA